MKYKTTQVKSARINMFDLSAWLKIRNKPKYQRCSNCGVEYSTLNDTGIGIIHLTDEYDNNIHVCNSCVEHFIQNGSIDLLKVEVEQYARKQVIIAILTSEFNIRERDIKPDYSLDWFESYLKKLQDERDCQDTRSIEMFTKLPVKAQEALKYICEVTKTTLTDMFFSNLCIEIFSNYSTVYSSRNHRWYNDISVSGKIGERNFKWDFAETLGDSCLHDMDWEFDFESLMEVESWETISDSTMLEWLNDNSENAFNLTLPHGIPFAQYIKQKMVNLSIQTPSI